MVRQSFGVLHIPKTAGTSLIEWLSDQFGESVAPQRFDPNLSDIRDLTQLDPDLRRLFLSSAEKPGPVVVGHFALTTLLRFHTPADIVTVLREPRCRLLSQQAFHASIPPEAIERWHPSSTATIGRSSLRDVLNDPRFAVHVDNVQLRMLLAPHPDIPTHDFIRPDSIAGLAQEAITRSSELGFVGVLEEGTALWSRLSGWLGREVVLGRSNLTRFGCGPINWAKDWDATTTRLLNLRTAGDRLLWNHVASNALGISASEDLDALADSLVFEYIGRASETTFQQRADGVFEDLRSERASAAAAQEAASAQILNAEAAAAAMDVRLSTTQAELSATQRELATLRASSSWKLGYAASRPVHALRWIVGLIHAR